MSMPQYITNVTSFNDAVKILRNKAILTESEINELSPQTKYNAAMKAVDKSYMSDNPSDIDRKKAVRQGNKFVSEIDPVLKKAVEDFGNSLGFNTKIEKGGTGNKLEPIIQILMGKELRAPEIKITIKKGTDKIEGGYNLPDEAAERRLGNLIKQIQQKELDVELKEEEEEDEMDDLIKKIGQEEEEEKAIKGGFGIYDPMEEDQELNEYEQTYRKIDGVCYRIDDEGNRTKVADHYCRYSEDLNEARKKKEPKKELHPNQIHPQELRMGIKVELEHTDDLNKAKKIALDHLAENPFYYTALKLSGIESPSAPKVKAPVEKKAKKKKEATELVDKANAMQKVKMPKKVVNEVRINAMPSEETNATIKQAMQYIDSDIANPTLKALSDKLELQPLRDNRAILRYGYWEKMPDEALAAVKKQFNVEEDIDTEEEKADSYIYIISSKNKAGNLGSSLEAGASKASKMDAFKEALEKLVRETLAETFDGRDNLANITDDTK
jgi:hypothetical protein